jgi:hypothetical protein
MTTALCLGGGDTLWNDLQYINQTGIKYDAVFACNDAGAEWPHELDGWVTLHPEKLDKWVQKREQNGNPPAKALYAHRVHKKSSIKDLKVTGFKFPGQRGGGSGSSGLFTAKVALADCGIDRVIFCGVPMTLTPHFFDKKDWTACKGFRRQWLAVDEKYRKRMRSCSGWTRVLLGGPNGW